MLKLLNVFPGIGVAAHTLCTVQSRNILGGVRGHAPPEIFEKFDTQRYPFLVIFHCYLYKYAQII